MYKNPHHPFATALLLPPPLLVNLCKSCLHSPSQIPPLPFTHHLSKKNKYVVSWKTHHTQPDLLGPPAARTDCYKLGSLERQKRVLWQRPEGQNRGACRAALPTEAPGEAVRNLCPALATLAVLGQRPPPSRLRLHRHPGSFPVSPVCLSQTSLCPSLTRTLIARFRAHLHSPGQSPHLKIFTPITQAKTLFRKSSRVDFPGSLVVKTPCFQYREHRFNLRLGN